MDKSRDFRVFGGLTEMKDVGFGGVRGRTVWTG